MVFGLLFSTNNSISAENYSLFGVMIGDDVNKYNPKSGIIEERLIIDPPKPNKNFVLYWVSINKKTNEIVGIGAYHKDVYPLSTKFKAGTITEEQFNEAIKIQKKCKMDTQVFIELIVALIASLAVITYVPETGINATSAPENSLNSSISSQSPVK